MTSHDAHLRDTAFVAFWRDVDAALAALGHDGAWVAEIERCYRDAMTPEATAALVAEDRDHERGPGRRDDRFWHGHDRRTLGLAP